MSARVILKNPVLKRNTKCSSLFSDVWIIFRKIWKELPLDIVNHRKKAYEVK